MMYFSSNNVKGKTEADNLLSRIQVKSVTGCVECVHIYKELEMHSVHF